MAITCTFMRRKELVNIRKEFNSHRICLQHQHNRRFTVLEHQQADLATERERQLTTACANQTTGLTNCTAANWAPEVDFSPHRASNDVPVLLLNQPSILLNISTTSLSISELFISFNHLTDQFLYVFCLLSLFPFFRIF